MFGGGSSALAGCVGSSMNVPINAGSSNSAVIRPTRDDGRQALINPIIG